MFGRFGFCPQVQQTMKTASTDEELAFKQKEKEPKSGANDDLGGVFWVCVFFVFYFVLKNLK